MIRHTRISAFADRAIEASWLLALVLAPYFFSLLSARHFEPDKATVVRALALVMLAAWAIKTVERTTMLGEHVNWRAWWRAPLAIPALVYGGVFLLTTITSISPGISWWGSYNRLQGTYTNLSYMAIFATIVGNLRTRAQIDRLITTTILAAFSVAVYGMIQHYGYDPLPWKGDVLTRISSTMGNSIFVAAYLIMVVPFVLMRIATSLMAFRQARERGSAPDLLWGGALLVLFVAQQAMLVGLLKFGAAVRVNDFRYWWVFPVALMVLTASFVLVSRRQTLAPSRALAGFAGGSLFVWAFLLLLVYSASSGAQQVDTNPLVADWALWTILGALGVGAFIAANFFLPAREQPETSIFAVLELIGYVLVLLIVLLAIFYSQSRGPQIGLLAGLAIFVNVLLVRLQRSAAATASPRLGLLRGLTVAAIAVELAAGAFLLAFNVSDAPFFERLRQVPYVGRFGQFLQTSEGTGRVRTLIWTGDGQGSGAVGLILSNPLRTIIGYGPETMFTAYNPFYPPQLAQYEARGASPDRSHQALLDELVTKGALGLLSYLFLFFSAGWLAWRLVRRSTDLYYQVLFIACLSAIMSHLFEGLTGIPIVSTLTMLWVVLGLMIAGGLQAGQLTLGDAPVAASEAAPVAVPAAPTVPQSAGRGSGKGRGARAGSGRTTTRSSGAATAAPIRRGGSFRWTYGLIAVLALLGVWFWNLRVVYADMWYNQASSFQPRSSDEELFKFSRVLQAVAVAPAEDYYYLQLGNSLIQLGYAYKLREPAGDADLLPAQSGRSMLDLFQGSSAREWAVNTWQKNSAEQLLDYARMVLERAYNLNPGNKDHPANLGRLHALWHGIRGERSHLDEALRWYAIANAAAPHDVVILNEWATTMASLGPEQYPEVEAKLKQSQTLDPSFVDTYVKLGNLYRIQGKHGPAAEQYVQVIQRHPNALDDGTLDAAIGALKDDPAALQTLVDAYRAAAEQRPKEEARLQSALGRVVAALGDLEMVRTAFDRAITMEPDNVRFRQQYTLALSTTQQYDAALQQAQAGLQLAQAQKSESDITTLTRLVEDIQRQKASGGS